MLMLSEESWSVSPVDHVLDAVNGALNRNTPPLGPTVDHTDTSVIVSLDADPVHWGSVPVRLMDDVPAELVADANVADDRVVTAEAFDVPLEPGPPVVCKAMYTVEYPVWALVVVSRFKAALARVEENASAIIWSPCC
jgi:hypothetical protein